MSDAASIPQPQPKPIPEGFIRPSHGAGLIRAPFTSEQARAAQARRGVDRWQEAQKMCQKQSPQSVRNLIRLEASSDDRVSLMASEKILTWAFGAPKQMDTKDLERVRMVLDLTKLSPEQIDLLLLITRSGAVRPADDAEQSPDDADDAASEPDTIDGTATETK